MNVNEAREAWLAQRHLYDRDDEDALREGFAAGWNAALPTIRGTGQGATHNSASQPGELEVTIWGHTKRGRSIALVYDEAAIARLVTDLERFDLLRRHP